MISAKLTNCYGDELDNLAVRNFDQMPQTLKTIVKKRHFRDTKIPRQLLKNVPAWFGIYNERGTLLDSGSLLSCDALRSIRGAD